MSYEARVITHFHSAIFLAIRGAARELTEQCNIPQPEADVKVLQALACELDVQADLPTLLLAPLLAAIRASVENDYKDVLAKVEAKCSKPFERSNYSSNGEHD